MLLPRERNYGAILDHVGVRTIRQGLSRVNGGYSARQPVSSASEVAADIFIRILNDRCQSRAAMFLAEGGLFGRETKVSCVAGSRSDEIPVAGSGSDAEA